MQHVILKSKSQPHVYLSGVTRDSKTIIDYNLKRSYIVNPEDFLVVHSAGLKGHSFEHASIDFTRKEMPQLAPSAYLLHTDGRIEPYRTAKTRLCDLTGADLDAGCSGLYLVSLDDCRVLVMDEQNDLNKDGCGLKLNMALKALVPASEYKGNILLLQTHSENDEISDNPLDYEDFFSESRFELDHSTGDLVKEDGGSL